MTRRATSVAVTFERRRKPIAPLPPGQPQAVVFRDRSGAKRLVILDCLPQQYVKLEPSKDGYVRRRWVHKGPVRGGQGLYVEMPPEPYVSVSTRRTTAKKAADPEPDVDEST